MSGWKVTLLESAFDRYGELRTQRATCQIIIVSEEMPSQSDILRVLTSTRLNYDWQFETISGYPITLYTIP